MSEDPFQGDLRGEVWCAALCVQSVQYLIPTAEPRPATAVRLALLWAQGVPVSENRLARASHDAIEAFAVFDDAVDAFIHDAVERGEFDVEAPPSVGQAAVAMAAHVVCRAAAYRAANPNEREGGPSAPLQHADVQFGGNVDGQPARQAALVENQVTPLPHPGRSPLGDWLLERDPTPGRIGTLGETLVWARQHGLRWWRPEHRWAAEHRIVSP